MIFDDVIAAFMIFSEQHAIRNGFQSTDLESIWNAYSQSFNIILSDEVYKYSEDGFSLSA